MWKLFGKNKENDKRKPTSNRVDHLADTLHKEGRTEELEGELLKIDQSSLTSEEGESWWHLFGIVAFQEGRDDEALRRFKEASKRFPESAMIRFSLGQQYIRANEIKKGFDLFRSCKFPDIPQAYALTQARYAYLWNKYSDALDFIRPFFDYYKKVRILDDHFLYVRGLPFFGHWWGNLAAFSTLSGELDELIFVTNYVAENCHDYDFDFLRSEQKAYLNKTPEILLPSLESALEKIPLEQFPTGYLRLRIAVIKSSKAKTMQEVEKALNNVSLSERDPPWLEDMRLLTLAESAHRFGNTTREQEFIDMFIKKQPLLFEPHLALKFHLLEFQENLKPLVRNQP